MQFGRAAVIFKPKSCLSSLRVAKKRRRLQVLWREVGMEMGREVERAWRLRPEGVLGFVKARQNRRLGPMVLVTVPRVEAKTEGGQESPRVLLGFRQAADWEFLEPAGKKVEVHSLQSCRLGEEGINLTDTRIASYKHSQNGDREPLQRDLPRTGPTDQCPAGGSCVSHCIVMSVLAHVLSANALRAFPPGGEAQPPSRVGWTWCAAARTLGLEGNRVIAQWRNR